MALRAAILSNSDRETRGYDASVVIVWVKGSSSLYHKSDL